jgi:hypothetical protein
MWTQEAQMRDSQKAGWKVAEYAELVGFCRSKLYTLPPQLQPKAVRVGTRRIIIEPPADYLARIAELQAAQAAT